MVQRIILTGVLLLTLSLFSILPAAAHGSEPRLEISRDRQNPGGVVDLRGVDFEPEEHITLSLTGPSTEISLGVVIADVEGIFVQTAVLPAELSEGTYYFLATTDDHAIQSPTLAVSGPPMLEEMGEEMREEDDALLAPMPTYAPGVAPGTVYPVVEQTAPKVAPVPLTNRIIFVLSFLGVGALVLVGLRTVRRK